MAPSEPPPAATRPNVSTSTTSASPCVYRKPKPGHSGDEGRQPAPLSGNEMKCDEMREAAFVASAGGRVIHQLCQAWILRNWCKPQSRLDVIYTGSIWQMLE